MSTKNKAHNFAVDFLNDRYTYEEPEKEPVQYKVEASDIVLDLKVLIKEYYCGTLSSRADTLTVKFSNGQKFCISVKEIK